MRIRRVSVLIDGGFFLKRLPKIVERNFCDSPEAVAKSARVMCRRHVQRLIGESWEVKEESRWLDHVYRIFYYDASPYEGVSQHPISNRRVDFGRSTQASFRRDLFNALRRERKFALRLGTVTKESDWRISPNLTKKLLKTRELLPVLQVLLQESRSAPDLAREEQLAELERLTKAWQEVGERDVTFGLRQKGVDMRIGLDIASMSLKNQIDTAILVSGDSDFVPAAKLARREGVEFILDPLWQGVSPELSEHIDGLFTPLKRGAGAAEEGAGE
ncbi:MAG: NYN domain-containing protein [Boseongicola sp. SB0675_bin_26]|nr:NYN domain-containing protein [Boseongicola sp. SB0675_bin_26]